MADGGLSSVVVTEENLNNVTTDVKQCVGDHPKREKSSFLSQLKKRLSFSKREKRKPVERSSQATVNEESENKDLNKTEHDKKINKVDKNNSKVEKTNLDKSENRFSAIRRSFGKGKNKENLLTKDMENKEIQKNRESMSQNQIRPQSMHIANSYPPRNGLLASFGWYWGPLSRSEATHRLRHQDDGSFLVRDSEGDPNKFTLSFKGAGQIFHNRILQHQSKYAFLPDEEFDSIPDLISDAMRRSATSAYCFSRSTDVAPTNSPLNNTLADAHNPQNNIVGPNGQCTVGSNGTHHKHEVRLLKPISRYTDSPRSLFYLCRFMIRQYTKFQDLCKLVVNPDIISYLEDPKYNL